jgi:hypothetical protein
MRAWRSPGVGERPPVAVPPARMPLLRAGRPLKAWRWVGVFTPELMLCAASARVGVAATGCTTRARRPNAACGSTASRTRSARCASTAWTRSPSRTAGALRFAAEATRVRRENLLVVRSDYEQPFGTFSGELPGAGPLRQGCGVMERHEVRW